MLELLFALLGFAGSSDAPHVVAEELAQQKSETVIIRQIADEADQVQVSEEHLSFAEAKVEAEKILAERSVPVVYVEYDDENEHALLRHTENYDYDSPEDEAYVNRISSVFLSNGYHVAMLAVPAYTEGPELPEAYPEPVA